MLPQIPLTLTNAIIVTAAVSRQLFPNQQHPVNEANLAITTGLGNLLSAPFGGYLMCHGAGGIAGHFRFPRADGDRARAYRPDLRRARNWLRRERLRDAQNDPGCVLGGLLLFSGIELALSSKLHEHQGGDLFLWLLMAAIGVALNPAAAFAVGLPIAYAFKREWLRV